MPVANNTRVIGAAKQSAKGTPAASPTVFFPLSGDAALNPNREIIQLPETDASSQRPNNVVVGASPGGGWQGWWRNSCAALLSEGILGAVAAGVYTPAQALPYYTFWDIIPGEMCTRYDDGRFSQLQLSGQSLQGIGFSTDAVALKATLGVTPPSITLPTDVEYSYPFVAVSVGGVHAGTHDSFTVTINRNVTLIRGDNGLDSYDSWPGLLDVTGQLLRVFEDDTDYRKFHGGAAAATVLTTTIFTESLGILLDDGTNSTLIESAGIEYTGIGVPVGTDAAPILQTLDFSTKRQATIGNNIKITLA